MSLSYYGIDYGFIVECLRIVGIFSCTYLVIYLIFILFFDSRSRSRSRK